LQWFGPTQPAQRITDYAHECANRRCDANLERCALEVFEIDEQSQTVELARPRALHHVLPVGSSRQLVEKQVDTTLNEQVVNAERCEGDDHTGGYA
jgi:hypothetical protein